MYHSDTVGIYGVIPLRIRKCARYCGTFFAPAVDPEETFELPKRYVPLYEHTKKKDIYILKPEILFDNFKPFFLQFNELIQEEGFWIDKEWSKLDKLAKAKDYDGYLRFLDERQGYNEVPTICDGVMEVSEIHIHQGIFFYHGGDEALFEGTKSLVHMERLIGRSLDNPLAKIVKVCLFS
ncbi:MAG: hypothetical protein LBR22_11640 [Desulfovibrio sp.]|jgi:hypothetical protein|nr:hypothetical protein [Desulfovibrio sp.]